MDTSFPPTIASLEIQIPDGPCIATRIRTNSIRLGNRYVNLEKLSFEVNVSNGYLSRALRDPGRSVSVALLKRLAIALGVSTDDMITLIEDRKKTGNRSLELD